MVERIFHITKSEILTPEKAYCMVDYSKEMDNDWVQHKCY